MSLNKKEESTKENNNLLFSYIGIIFVVIMWGLAPIITVELYDYYSSSISSAITSFVSVACILIYSRKKLKLLNADYFKPAITFGFFLAGANLSQKLGLTLTTPTHSAFLENLSCVVVPFLSFLFIRKKPTVLKIVASVICLIGALFLSGIDLSTGEMQFGAGEILCSIAGLFYGVNIAGTGAFAKKLDSALYVMIQMSVLFVMSIIASVFFNFVPINGAVIEKVKFSIDFLPLLSIVAYAIVMNALCWIIRAHSQKTVDATFVAIAMPVSSVITGAISILMGKENVTFAFVMGVALGILAIFVSICSDIIEIKMDKKRKLRRE